MPAQKSAKPAPNAAKSATKTPAKTEKKAKPVPVSKTATKAEASAEEIVVKKKTPLVGSDWWVMLVNPSVIPMSQVYRLFLFESQSDTRLSKKVEAAIEQGLQESLESYFLSQR